MSSEDQINKPLHAQCRAEIHDQPRPLIKWSGVRFLTGDRRHASRGAAVMICARSAWTPPSTASLAFRTERTSQQELPDLSLVRNNQSLKVKLWRLKFFHSESTSWVLEGTWTIEGSWGVAFPFLRGLSQFSTPAGQFRHITYQTT